MTDPSPPDPGPRERDDAFLRRLAAAPPSETRRRLVDYTCTLAGTFLGFDDEPVGPREEFLELGFDSLLAVDFKILLETRLGCALPSTVLFDCPTPESLVTHLLAALGLHGEGAPRASTSAPARRRHELPDAAALARLSADELRALVQQQSARLAAVEDARAEPIAIVGMACRFPGGANDAERFWQLQRDGIDAIAPTPASRWDVERYYDPDRAAPGKLDVREGGWLDDVEHFDARFFGISPREATQLDPQQRVLLEVAWEALEHAGVAPDSLAGTPAGVFLGTRGPEYFMGHTDWRPEDAETYYATGNSVATLAGRLSYVLGITGPSFAIDTACSSSLVALHQAVQSLRRGECNAALAGGVNLLLDPFGTIAICKANMLSPRARCRTFDAGADGYVRAEGVGVLVLERLSRARAEGHRVLALVRGSAVNQDGASGGLTVPSGPAQEAVIRAALADGGVTPDEVDFVEAHGTGTSLGDPIEVAALDAVFGESHGERPLWVGSVKTNIGHCEPAAGAAGLIKVVQALRHGELPPHLHLEQPNPHIPWDATCVRVPERLTPWPRRDGTALGGVSSFGFGGTNAHVVLERAPDPEPPAARLERPCALVTLSARDEPALQQQLERLAARLDQPDPPALADVAYSLHVGRAQHAWRAALPVGDLGELRASLARGAAGEGLRGKASGQPPKVAFLFTGQGSQYAGMGRQLDAQWPAFRRALDACDAALRPHLDVPLRELLWGAASERLSRTDGTQPALFAVGWSLAKLWESWGVRPTWVAGHSVGELAAACLAGVLSLEDACALVAARGRLMVEHTPPGAMLAVFAERDVLEPHLRGHEARLAVAAHNCAGHLVLSGTTDAVGEVAARLDAAGVRHQALDVSHAFHSPLMDGMLGAFEQVARGVSFSRPRLGFVSCLRPGVVSDALTAPDYWVRHVREPVRFVEGMQVLAEQGCDALVEIGPAPVLLGMAKRFLLADDVAWLPSLRPGRAETTRMLTSLGELWVRGAEVDWRGLHTGDGARLCELPGYPFQRQRYWLDGRKGRGTRRDADAHPLLGAPLPAAVLADGQRLFGAALRADDPAWLADHQAWGRVVLPAAAFLEAALCAGRQALGSARVALRDVTISAPLVLGEAPVDLQLLLEPRDAGLAFRQLSRARDADGPWTLHAAGRLELAGAADGEALATVAARTDEDVDVEAFYALYDEVGLGYGPAFRVVRQLSRNDDEALARLELPEAAQAVPAFGLHPVLLDGAFQTCRAVALRRGLDAMYLPVGFERVQRLADPGRAAWAHVALRSVSDDARLLVFDLDLLDEAGRALVSVRGQQLLRTTRSAFAALSDPLEGLGHVLGWSDAPRAAASHAAPTGGWLLVGDEQAERLERALQLRGAVVARVSPDELPDDDAALDARLAALALPEPLHVVHCARTSPPPATADALAAAPWHAQPRRVLGSALAVVRAVLRRGTGARAWFVTTGAAAAAALPAPVDPDGALLWGLGASLALEHPGLSPTCIDLDPHATGSAAEDAALLAELLEPDAETRLAFRDGARRVARLLPRREPPSAQRLELPRAEAWRLAPTRYGVLEDLALLPMSRRAPGPGEVEVALRAAGLNFKDVLYALGVLPGADDPREQRLGLEGAGRVVAVGAGVTHVAVGDEVVVAAGGCLASHVTTRAEGVAPKAARLDAPTCATLPTVWMTVLHGLQRCAALQPGETVLVHAAAGGVGQAALAYARGQGARVVATASRPKHAWLRAQGVEHVFDSRTLEFEREVLAATDGRGVDVVLNSLSGEAVDATLRCLAPGGRFVEIGKVGVKSPDELRAARPDIQAFQFDMAELYDAEPRRLLRDLGDTVARLDAGTATPLPLRAFGVRDAVAAFQHMASGRHVGKLVLSLDPPRDDHPPVRKDAAYLVTGGLGALGLLVARWLVEQGARQLVLVGRSAPGEAAREALAELADAGADVRVAAADVSDHAAVAALLASIEPPLAGVFHCAGVLDDGVVENLDWERVQRVLAPKAAGARNLHVLTRHAPLDHFVLFASMVSLVGAQGQASYAAANAALDALAAHRRGLGLPGLAIDWGPWAGAGMAAGTAERNAARFADLGIGSLDPDEALAALDRLLRAPPAVAQVGVLPVRWSRYLARLPGAAPPWLSGLAAHTTGADSAGEGEGAHDDVLARLRAADDDEAARELLAAWLSDQLARVMGFGSAAAIDRAQPFVDMGVDSLLAVDLRNRLEASLGLDLPAALVFDHPSVDALLDHVLAALGGATLDPDSAALLAEIEDLSDDEVTARLSEGGDG